MPLVKAKIRIGYPQDFLAAYLIYGVLKERIDPEGISFSPACLSFEALERRLLKGELEAGMICLNSFFKMADRFAIIPFGVPAVKNEGPVLASLEDKYPKDLAGKRVLVPGSGETASMLCKLFLPPFTEEVQPTDKALEALKANAADAILLSGSARWFAKDWGLKTVADLGAWFCEKTRLGLPESVWVIRKDLGRDVMRKVTRLLRDSLMLAFKKESAEAVSFAAGFAPGVTPERVQEIIRELDIESMEIISRHTKDAIVILQNNFHEANLLKDVKKIEYVDM